MKKILFLSQFFYPDKSGTGKIVAELCFALAQKDFLIDVVSSCQIYNDKKKRILPEYEEINKVKIYRVFKFFLSKEQTFGRLFNYLSFFLLSAKKIFQKNLQLDKDIIISVSNPPIMPLLAVLLKGKKNKTIYIVHDLYPDIAIKMGVVSTNSLLAKIMFQINHYVFNRIDKIVVLGRDMKIYLLDNYHIPETKIHIFPNWSARRKQEIVYSKKDKFRIIYSGNIGRFHNLEMAVKAIAEMPYVELFFIGEGAQKQSLIRLSEKYDNINFSSYMDSKSYNKILNSADALLVSLEKNLSGLAIPSKFYTYLSVGKPIICISDKDTEMSFVIQEAQCGIIIYNEDHKKFIEKLKILVNSPTLCAEMGERALKIFSEKYEMSVIFEKYEKFLEELV